MAVSVRARLPTSIGPPEEAVEHRAGGPFGARPLVGGAHLAEHLALAEDGRVDPGGDLEQVSGGCVVELDDQGLIERRDRRLRVAKARLEERLDVGETFVEALGQRVHLGAHAGRQHDPLGEVRAVAELGERLRELLVSDRQPIEDVERCIAFVQADDDDWHAGSFRARKSGPSPLECYGFRPGLFEAAARPGSGGAPGRR